MSATTTFSPDLSLDPSLDPSLDLAPLSDDELAAFALAADPDLVVAADAPPLAQVLGVDAPAHLPEWYMPTPMGGRGVLRGWRRQVVYAVIASFLTITAYGLCNTYGDLHLG